MAIDFRCVNKAIKRPFIQIPVVEDVLHKLQGAKVFSKLDMPEAFHQVSLSEKSRNLTTFYDPNGGLARFNRLCYGITSTSEYFHDILHNKTLNDIRIRTNYCFSLSRTFVIFKINCCRIFC